MKNTGWIIFHSFCAGIQFAILMESIRLGHEATALWCLSFFMFSVLFVVLSLTVFQKPSRQ